VNQDKINGLFSSHLDLTIFILSLLIAYSFLFSAVLYDTDAKLVKDINLNSFRFSVEWSRKGASGTTPRSSITARC
jgi:hypothetical protein